MGGSQSGRYHMVGGSGGGGGGWCGCDGLNDLIYGVDPVVKQRRTFMRDKAPTLVKGMMFRLLASEDALGGAGGGAGAIGALGSKIGGWFTAQSKRGRTSDLGPENVWVSCDDLMETVEWRTMQNVEGKPKDSGSFPLCRVKDARKDGRRVIISDHSGNLLLDVEAESEADCNIFVLTLTEALSVLAPELQESRTEEEQKQSGVARKMARWKRIEDRKAAAAAKKKALGSVGMKFTAQAMASRG